MAKKSQKSTSQRTTKKPSDHALDELLGPLTVGRLVRSVRECDAQESLAKFAKRLGIGRQTLYNLERDDWRVSIEKAAEYAKKLQGAGFFVVPEQWVKAAAEHGMRRAGFGFLQVTDGRKSA